MGVYKPLSADLAGKQTVIVEWRGGGKPLHTKFLDLGAIGFGGQASFLVSPSGETYVTDMPMSPGAEEPTEDDWDILSTSLALYAGAQERDDLPIPPGLADSARQTAERWPFRNPVLRSAVELMLASQ
jgi:hypothetical protein